MANEWHYTQNGQPAPTPVSTAELKQMAASGRLQPSDLVWQDGMPNWVPASSIKGLFPAGRTRPESAAEVPVVAPADSGRERAETVKPRDKDKPKERAGSGRKRDADLPPEPDAVTSSSVLLEMHPVLVFLLSVVTLGIFGLLYALAASTAVAKIHKVPATDSAGRPLGKFRHPVRLLVLSIVTLGFYFPFWLSRALRECNAYLGRTVVGSRLEFCLMLVLPFYAAYVARSRLTVRTREVQARAGVPPEERLDPVAALFGGWLVAMACQEALNQVWQSAA